jgi:hypothetical protein
MKTIMSVTLIMIAAAGSAQAETSGFSGNYQYLPGGCPAFPVPQPAGYDGSIKPIQPVQIQVNADSKSFEVGYITSSPGNLLGGGKFNVEKEAFINGPTGFPEFSDTEVVIGAYSEDGTSFHYEDTAKGVTTGSLDKKETFDAVQTAGHVVLTVQPGDLTCTLYPVQN